MVNKSRALKRERYLGGDGWRCATSPTGSHHWDIGDANVGTCRHCPETRQFKFDAHMVQPNPGIDV